MSDMTVFQEYRVYRRRCEAGLDPWCGVLGLGEATRDSLQAKQGWPRCIPCHTCQENEHYKDAENNDEGSDYYIGDERSPLGDHSSPE